MSTFAAALAISIDTAQLWADVISAFGLASFQRALLEALLVGALSGALSVHVMVRRLPFFVLAMSHATFPGVVLAALLGFNLFLGGAVAGLSVVAVVLLAGRLSVVDDSNITGVMLAGSFAVGLLLQAARKGGTKNIASYLVGSILSTTITDLVIAAVITAVVLIGLFVLHKELTLTAFDPVGAQALGYRTWAIHGLLLSAVVVVMVASIPAVGTLLSVSLLTIPGLTARQWTDRLGTGVVIGAVVGTLSGLIGLVTQAAFYVAAGGAISLAATALFAVSVLVRRLAETTSRNALLGRSAAIEQ